MFAALAPLSNVSARRTSMRHMRRNAVTWSEAVALAAAGFTGLVVLLVATNLIAALAVFLVIPNVYRLLPSKGMKRSRER
jgi:uncharacterized membrane protein YhfC